MGQGPWGGEMIPGYPLIILYSQNGVKKDPASRARRKIIPKWAKIIPHRLRSQVVEPKKTFGTAK